MSLKFNTQDRPRKRDRFLGFIKKPFSRSSSNRAQSDTSSAGENIEHPAVALQSMIQVEHHGHSFNTTNTGSGPVNNLGHVENAHFHLSDGGSDALLWNSLPKQRDTSGQHSEYLEGSREGDVQDIMQWIDSPPPGELVLWVRGAAGVGKSTLARHLTHLLRDKNRLAASVSISAVPTDARGAESVVKIIAREMITIHPEVIPVIRSAVSSCHGTPLGRHIQEYVCDPSRSLRLPGSAIFILDATDEWEYLDAFVKELESISTSSATFKLVFLGRSDPRTRGYEGAWIRSYLLEPVSNTTMGRYIVKELALVKWDIGRAPSERQIVKLVELADGLFIWAKVVCSLLKKKLSLSSASETLEAIIHSRRSIAAEGGLSALYHQAIMWLFPESEDQELLQRYLGAVLVLQEPLPVDAFSSLAGLPIHIVESLKEELTALQIRQPVGDAILQIHPRLRTIPPLIPRMPAKPPPRRRILPFLYSVARRPTRLSWGILLDGVAQQKYAVKHMPLHVHRGTPSVEPESDVDWRQTPHSSLLQDMPIPSLLQWGHLFVASVQPSYSAEDTKFSGESRGTLMSNIAAILEEESEVTLPVLISCLEVAVRLEPGNPHSWSKLGWAYRDLAMSTRSRDACDRAVQAQRNSLKVDGLSDSDGGHMLFSLGTVLNRRHEYFGSPHDLEEAITVFWSALDACAPDHEDYEACLNNLSAALHKTGSTSDRHESIQLLRKLLELNPPGHPGRNRTLDNLANSLSQTGAPNDLRESIPLYREALELRPPGHPRRGATLNNLAAALLDTGSPDDSQESIQLYREALELQPLGHPDRHDSLGGLAIALEGTGSPDVLQESIQLKREALELRPPGHPMRDISLNNLAFALSKTGSPGDLEESICHYQEALELRPPGHPRRATVLKNLADALEKRGSPGDQEEAKRLREEAQAIRSSR
ncbi:hypothetical protein NMY22_g17697 [Coprinellus aureogranulatus]|nr:hypothetical protein NMY22_g17697 [Coprinellus aureogranulatus]